MRIWQIVAPGTTPIEVVQIGLVVAAKVALPLLIIPFPFVAGWLNFLLDGFDGDILIPLGLPNDVYQPVDKLTDWLTYVAIVIVAFRNGWPTRMLMLGLFIYRSIGQVAFLVTENELLLAFFPNFLEPLFLVTVSILAYERTVRHVPDWQDRGFAILERYRWPIAIVIVIAHRRSSLDCAARRARTARSCAMPSPACALVATMSGCAPGRRASSARVASISSASAARPTWSTLVRTTW